MQGKFLHDLILTKTNALILEKNITCEQCGIWLYAEGKTLAAQRKLLQLGFRWDGQKRKYTWHPGPPVKKRFPFKTLTYSQVKVRYGCERVA